MLGGAPKVLCSPRLPEEVRSRVRTPFLGGGEVVGRRGFLGRVEDAEVSWSSALRDLGDPAPCGLVEVDAPEGALALAVGAIRAVLTRVCKPQVASAVIEAIAVDVVGQHLWWCAGDLAVKVDRFLCTLDHLGANGVAVAAQAPGMSCGSSLVFRVKERPCNACAVATSDRNMRDPLVSPHAVCRAASQGDLARGQADAHASLGRRWTCTPLHPGCARRFRCEMRHRVWWPL